MSKQDRERREAIMKNRLSSPEILQWYRDNEGKLHDPKFMPDYPVNEKLPLIGDSEIVWPSKAASRDEYEAMAEFASVVSGIVNGQWDLGLTDDEIAFINAYFNEGYPIEDIGLTYSRSVDEVKKYGKELRDRIINIKRRGVYKCSVCNVYKRVVDFYSKDLCIDCSERTWDREEP